MKVFTCDDHKGWWPVPTASVVIAEDEEEARKLLKIKLRHEYAIEDDSFTLKEVDITAEKAIVLSYGDY